MHIKKPRTYSYGLVNFGLTINIFCNIFSNIFRIFCYILNLGEKPFKCNYCNDVFRHDTALRKHKRLHIYLREKLF